MPHDEPAHDLPPLATPDEVKAVDDKLTALTQRVVTLEGKSHVHDGTTPVPPPPPPPPPDPTHPELPGEIPAGKEVAITDLVARMNVEPIGTVFRVKPGRVDRATLPYKDGFQLWFLDQANTLLHGMGAQWLARGPARDTVTGFLRATGYCPANPAWTNVSVRTNPGLYRIIGGWDGDSLPSARLHKAEIFECGRGVTVGHDMVLEDCDLHHCHHMNITGYGKRNVKILGGKWHHANLKPGGGHYYTFDWEVSNKFVHCVDGLIDDYQGRWFESFENAGPGIWPDINNDRFVIRHFKAYRNKGIGMFWEVSFQATIEDGEVWENGDAANVLISRSRGTAANPIKVRRLKTWGHPQWEIAMSDTSYRPLSDGGGPIDFVEITDNIIDAKPGAAGLRYHKYGNPPYPTSLVTRGNKRSDGTPVLLTHSSSP